MKKLHLAFTIIYVATAFVLIWALSVESLRDTWIWAAAFFIGIAISIFSHIKLLINNSKIKGEMTFLWLTFLVLLIPVISFFIFTQVMGDCGGGIFGCLPALLTVLMADGLLWIVTIILGMTSVLRKNKNLV